MNMKELIERVRAAQGPDRELDFDLLEMAGIGYYDYTRGHYEYQADKPDRLDLEKRYWEDMPTNSIDAALALVERAMPNASWGVRTTMEGVYAADVPFVKLKDMWPTPVTAPTAPLAIILALLTALDQKEENK